MMTMNEAMKCRHMVRKYQDKTISKELIEKLEERITKNNQKSGLSMKLVTNDTKGLNLFAKIFFAKGVKNYIILSGTDDDNLEENVGYYGSDIMLYAQALGLNTWWIGSTYNKKISGGKPEDKIVGIIAVGYGENQGVPHHSKSMQEVSHYEGEKPAWFIEGVMATLLAPTALNKQSFIIKGKGKEVTILCENDAYCMVNTGILKYHFELGAGDVSVNIKTQK